MHFSPLIQSLVEALCQLPGVGPKTAQRMALQLLEQKREAGLLLAEALQQAMEKVGQCQHCRIPTEQTVCDICSASRRDETTLCVVGTPADVFAIESSHEYNGRYFVLSGQLSPLDGLGPVEIGIPELLERIEQGPVDEIILATSTTAEGEATAFYISEQLRDRGVRVSRIAHGVPLGGGLEFVDGGTIARALSGRSSL